MRTLLQRQNNWKSLATEFGFFFLLLALTPYHLLSAQKSAPRNDSAANYTRTIWGVAAGLPEDTVQALAESADGHLWVGTTGGMASFDGAHIQSARGDLSLAGVNSVFALLSDGDGSLWAGTEGGGLLHIHDGVVVRVFGTADGLADGFVRAIHRDSRGVLWVGTDDGLYRQVGSRFQRVDASSTVPAMAVHSITEDRRHRIWAGGSTLISISPQGDARRYSVPGSYSKSRVKTILQTRDGEIWVGTVGGLARLDGDTFRAVGNVQGTVRSLLETADGSMLIGTIGDGLLTFHNGRLDRMGSPDLLPSRTVLSLLQDDSGQIWIGTQAGLVRLVSTPVRLVRLPKAGDPDFETLAGDRDGTVWVAAQKLYRVSGNAAEEVELPGLAGASIRNVMRARDGALWVGTDGSGAYRLAQGSIRHFSAPAELTNNFPRAFLEARNGDMWIATDEGVSAITSQGARHYTQASGLAYFSTRCMLQDREGVIWIGTERGLSAWRNGSFESNAATRAMAHEKVWSSLQDASGVLWFGTRDHGLFRYRADRMEQITTEQGLPTNSIYQLLQDRHGIFWMTGPNTVASVDAVQMDGPMPTTDRPLRVAVYGMPFGAEDAQFYGGREPAGYLATDDSVWFPTTRGVAHLATNLQSFKGPPPRVSVVSVAEDGRPANLEQGMEVDSHVTRLGFAFAATDLRPRADLRFRYRLDELDHDWIAAGAVETATYTNLKAGHYHFRVQAIQAEQPDHPTEVVFPFTKRPYFYQTWWFYALCGAAVLASAWTVYALRLRRMRTRFEDVLKERNRMARELHDTVLQGCTGVSAVLEAMAVASATGNGNQEELLDYAREQTRSTIHEARRAVWNMRHEREGEAELLDAMRGLAAQTMRERKHVSVSVKAPSSIKLRTTVLTEVSMILREAMSNALQHSGAALIELSAEARGDSIVICVRDFGRGMNSATAQTPPLGHFGIVGMRERTEKLGGKFELITAPEEGTTVKLELSLARGRETKLAVAS